MHCPHCDQPLTEQTCPHCHASLLDTGPYCGYCGRRRQETASPEDKAAAATSSTADAEDAQPDDWDRRVLCSDGNCIGVIGPDGRCNECGKPLEGDATE